MYAQNLLMPNGTAQSMSLPVQNGLTSQTSCPPPPPHTQQALILNVSNRKSGALSPCPACGTDTGNIPRKKLGCVAIAWCVCLMVTTFGIGCCYAICNDSCKDVEILCVKCQTIKTKVPATCC